MNRTSRRSVAYAASRSSTGSGRYTSAQLWAAIRDRNTPRVLTLPDRIYFSRVGMRDRKLANEAAVERIFETFKFTIVRPENIRVEFQVAIAANARFIAGPSGSGLFNLAFQGSMRSAFILVWEHLIQVSEMLLSAGRGCEIWYHVGRTVSPNTSAGTVWEVELERLENDVAEWLIQTRS